MAGKRTDTETEVMLYKGCNLSQLGKAFRMDHRQLVEKLIDCPATGEHAGHKTWFIHVAAPFLVKPVYDVEAYIKRMHHNDLPKHLTKEFWAGLRSKQAYEKEEGELWPTERVISALGAFMKLVKMSVRLMSDQVHRQAELSERQRVLIRQQGDGLLEALHASVLEKFSEKPTNPLVIEMAEDAASVLIAPVEAAEDDDEL